MVNQNTHNKNRLTQNFLKPLQSWLRWGLISSIALIFSLWNLLSNPAIASQSIQPYLDRVVDNVNEFTLDNGMKFIVLERHEAPVVSFVTYADVGGVDEPDGQTGVAHYLEHLAFKGTTQIGTRNYPEEKKLLDRLDTIETQIQQAKEAGDRFKVAQLQDLFVRVEQEALQYVNQNEFGQIVEQQGGVGLNAATSSDYTAYFYSFPSNKLELWMSLESERFLDPVFREFNKEKQVILEERRLRTDNSPVGQMIEAFLDKTYTTHPYKRPVIGYNRDIRNLTRKNVEDFFAKYYVPNNLTVAIVGDVNPQEVQRLAKIYFGRYETKPAPPEVNQPEPPQQVTKEVTLSLPSQPWYFEGYHRPAIEDKDNAVYDIITDILSEGRTSRLYKSLVVQKQVALNAVGFSGFPGDKYPNLVIFYGLTAPGHSLEEVANALEEEITKLKTEPVLDSEIDRVKTIAKANMLRTLDSNSGMARLLAEYQGKTGDWRNLFKQLEAIEKVTAADVQRVAQTTFTAENKTIGKILPVTQ